MQVRLTGGHTHARIIAAFFACACAASCGAATIAVNTAADVVAVDGFCSLREAITSVNTQSFSGNVTGECAAGDGNNDTITLPAGTYVLTISGADEDNNATGDLDVRASVAILGAGIGQTIVDAASLSDRVFDLPVSGIDLGLRDMTIQNGHAPDSAAISGEPGGAINNANGANVSLTRVELANNHSGNGASGSFAAFSGGMGGAIYTSGGSLQLLSCALHDNTSGAGGSFFGFAGSAGSGGNGGAIGSINTGLGIELTTFDRNQTGDGGSSSGIGSMPGSPGFGGGIYANGGSMTVLQSSFDGNHTSSQTSGGSGGGGAVFVYSTTTQIAETSMTRNAAFDGGGFDSGDSTFTLTNVTLSGNYAGQFGGGLFVFGGSGQLNFVTLSGNQAAIDSGGARIENGNSGAASVSFRNSIISGNAAPSMVDCNVFSGNTLNSLGYNVAGDGCTANAVGDVATTNPHLGPLADNGGVGLTQTPQPSGPATDGGNCLASATSIDQRGDARLIDVPRVPNAADACDIGAVELDDDIFWDGFGN